MKADGYRNVVVLTGAGISSAAGLATYRGPGGLWNDEKVIALAQAGALASRRVEATDMFWALREAAAGSQPTAAHRALAAFEARTPGDFLLVTQNVDGLHQRAGSKKIVEYHGGLREWYCARCGERAEPATGGPPPEHCGERMRPDAVLFGEDIPAAADHAVTRALRDCDLFVAIGTSGTVWPAAGFVRSAAYAGARTVLLNLEIDAAARDQFAECHAGPADELVAAWFA